MLTGCKELKLHIRRANGFIRDMLIILIFTEINTKNRPSRFKGKKNKYKNPHFPPPYFAERNDREKHVEGKHQKKI